MNFQFSMIAFFKLVPFGLVPLSISAFWQTVKLLNFFSFQGLPIDRIVGAKNKIKTIVDIFFFFKFPIFLFSSFSLAVFHGL
jgi:hypothetical protein